MPLDTRRFIVKEAGGPISPRGAYSPTRLLNLVGGMTLSAQPLTPQDAERRYSLLCEWARYASNPPAIRCTHCRAKIATVPLIRGTEQDGLRQAVPAFIHVRGKARWDECSQAYTYKPSSRPYGRSTADLHLRLSEHKTGDVYAQAIWRDYRWRYSREVSDIDTTDYTTLRFPVRLQCPRNTCRHINDIREAPRFRRFQHDEELASLERRYHHYLSGRNAARERPST